MPREEAIAAIKAAIAKTYGRRGPEVVARNDAAVDASLAALHQVQNPGRVTVTRSLPPVVPADAPEFIRAVTAEMMDGLGEELPVSALPVDGTYPTGTAAYEKRNISDEVAAWDPDLCIQCGNCSFVCPHSVIRSKFYDVGQLAGAPDGFPVMPLDARGLPEARYTLQVYAEDCTGCGLCVEACPAIAPGDPSHKAINLAPREPLVDSARRDIAFFETIPVNDRSGSSFGTVRGTQFLQPLFEFSSACAGCGETPYLKLLSQLFGDRLMIANATGCSSIYGGNLPTTPWTTNKDGRGPAWANSPFEDNAEFGLGYRLAADQHLSLSRRRRAELKDALGPGGRELAEADPDRPAATRNRVPGPSGNGSPSSRASWGKLDAADPAVADLNSVVDNLVRRSVWIVGGDGWAYDIGSGGLDHVLSTGRDVNVLVMDTEVYSNTGGQASKSTPIGAVAKFARPARGSRKRTSRCRRSPTATSTWPGWRWALTRSRRCTRSARRRRIRDVADVRLQPLHRTRHREGRQAAAQRDGPAVPRRGQRLLAAGPLRPGAARRRPQPVPARLAPAARCRCPTTPAASFATASSPAPTPRPPSACPSWPSSRSASGGPRTRKWPPAARNGSRPAATASRPAPRTTGAADEPQQPATSAWTCATRWSPRPAR